MNLLDTDQNSSPVNKNPPSNLGHENGVEAGPSKEVLDRPYKATDYETKSVPWHRQGKWRIAMLIAAIIVIGAVVGGAVGSTVGKHKNNTNTSTGPSTAVLPSSTEPSGTGGPSIVPGSSSTPLLISSSSQGGAATGATGAPTGGTVGNPTGGGNNADPPQITGAMAHAAIVHV